MLRLGRVLVLVLVLALPGRVPQPVSVPGRAFPSRSTSPGGSAMCSLASGAVGGYPAAGWSAVGREKGALRRTGRGCGFFPGVAGWECLSACPPGAQVSCFANSCRVLGGRGAVDEDEDLPELSDSGDEAAWEDEDDADLPHDKQQTPCLFCERFVLLGARVPGIGPQRPT